jgi:hypothetical protein
MKTTQTKLNGIAGHLIIALILIAVCRSGIQAQNFSSYPANPEYGKNGGMNQYKVKDDSHFSSSSTDDPRANLTMECLAANGYGQWTCSSSPGANVAVNGHWLFSPDQPSVNSGHSWDYSSGWFLLGNMISEPSEKYLSTDQINHPGCQPPGIVSGGKFLNITVPSAGGPFQCKAAVNLLGSVRFVAVDATDRTKFRVEGLNDDRGATTNDRQIDISLNDDATSALAHQVVKSSIFPYPSTGTQAIATGNGVWNGETFWQDEFDIAMDTKYLYITWCYYDATNYNIYAMAVNISDGSVALASTQVIAGGIGHQYRRPTIDCDRRGPYNTNGDPEFAVAYIDMTLNTVSVAEYVPSIPGFMTEVLTGTYKNFSWPYTLVTTPYATATHARVLVSSVAGSSSPVYSAYVICEYGLIFYRQLHFSTTIDIASYVDGIIANSPPPANSKPYPLPMVQADNLAAGNGVVDKPIVAFANPYDNQDLTNGYHQFHCLYQLNALDASNNPFHPLILVHSADNGYPGSGTSDTRVLLNQYIIGGVATIVDDPDPTVGNQYVAAVNQMGIHVHWRTAANATNDQSTHFYFRDIRAFDELIEENTLITNVCYVRDGSSHGGSSGATGNKSKITIWTDPNYGFNYSDPTSGLYFKSNYTPSQYTAIPTPLNRYQNIGTVQFFNDNNISLGLSGTAFEIPNGFGPGNLYTAPNINIAFSASATGQGIDIGDGSTWDFFGTSQTDCFTNPGQGAIALLGIELFDLDTAWSILNIHPGGKLWGGVPLYSTMGKVNIQYGPSISPLGYGGPANAPASAFWSVDNIALLTDSKVNSYLPSSIWTDVLPSDHTTNIVMELECALGDPTVYTLSSLRTDYTNYGPPSDPTHPGTSSILYEGASCQTSVNCVVGPNKVVFNGGSFDHIRFHARSPVSGGLEITNMHIRGIDLIPIHIEQLNSSCPYSDILIEHNTFEDNLFLGDPFDGDIEILIEGFNNSSSYDQVNVSSNKFAYYNDPSDIFHRMDVAINFINSSGIVENNIITNPIYRTAEIIMTSVSILGVIPITHSYLCKNTLANNSGFNGINSDHYNGYVNGCTISSCLIGYQSGLNDQVKMINSSITGCDNNGISINGSSGSPDEVDLSGYHNGADDVAAFNTISGNGTFAPGASSQVVLNGNAGISKVDYGNIGGWLNWGKNNTSAGGFALTLISGSGTAGNVDGNFWTDGSTGSSPATSGFISLPSTNWSVSTGTCSSTPPPWLCVAPTIPPFTCNPIFPTIIHKENNKIFSVDQSLAYDTCAHLKLWEHKSSYYTDTAFYRQQFDSLRLYIELCAASDNESPWAFSSLDNAVQLMSNDSSRYDQYRAWLISVLYLNTTNPNYFCACMGSISNTYPLYGKYGRVQNAVNAPLAIRNWLRINRPDCIAGDSSWYTNDTIYLRQHGIDPTKLPPLDSIGLGFLLKSGVTPATTGIGMPYLASFTSNPNPFTTFVKLNYVLNRMSYVTIEVYDLLGNKVYGNAGHSYEAGSYEINLDGNALPSGTLYARISTGFGEVKTVKLVHEK